MAYSRSILGGSDENYGRSVLGGIDEDYSRSVLGGSAEDYSRSVLGGSEEYFSRSLLGGSDEVHEIHCEPCKKDGNTVDAVKHCVDCSEYFCAQCFKSHTRFKASQNHVTNDVGKANPGIIKASAETVSKSVQALSQLHIDRSNDQQSSRPAKVTSSKKPNRKVKAEQVSSMEVVDTRKKCVISEVQISEAEELKCITSVNDREVAVTVIIQGMWRLLFLSVSTSGIISNTGRTFDIKYNYNGIIHHNDCFYATWTNSIDIFSMRGQVLKQIRNNALGVLKGIALSNDHNTIFVCRNTRHTVFSVDLEGNIKATCKNKDLKGPIGVTVDNEGYVYVCSTYTNCVHQLTADLSKVQVIIIGIGGGRCTFNKAEKRLYVKYSDEIMVYDMKYE